MNSKTPSDGSWDPTVLYSDLDMSEGLAEALKRSASGIGLTLDRLVDGFGRAELVTGRGTVSIYVGAWERVFGIGIHESGIEWASGATDDLGQILRAIAAWQDGESLEDHVLGFPFMKPGRLARAFAERRVAEAQWQDLLDSEYRTEGQQLLVRLAQFGELRSFFPEIGYGELRFTEAPPRQDDRMFRVQSDGTVFRVRESGPELREYALDGIDEVARRIVEFFAAG
jgi:hypothetical protein